MTLFNKPYHTAPRTQNFFCKYLLSVGRFFILLILLGTNNHIYSQDTAQEKTEEKPSPEKSHSIKKATLYSTFLPGAGQAYNKKYWKMPIVYAGFGVFTYFIVVNTKEFKKFQEAYIYKVNGETYPIDNEYVDKYSVEQLESAMNDYRRNRDLSYIFAAVWYALQILDANVDAHFFDYDISEDITLRWEPLILPASAGIHDIAPPTLAGLKLSLKF